MNRSQPLFKHLFLHLLLPLLGLGLILPPVSYADPPSFAPAHGWRKKHDPYYVGYTGQKWPEDYGVVSGRCDYGAVGAVLGGVVGGAIGSQVGQGDGRTVAIIVGTVLGAAIGANIGRDMDTADRACIGHTLELAPIGRTVAWDNDHTGVHYLVTPTRGFRLDQRECREFTAERYYDKKRYTSKGKACRGDDGEWRIL
jgi:surface antigen